MLKTFCIASLIIACLPGCSSSKKASTVEVIGSWINKDSVPDNPRNSVFITVLTQDLNVRSPMEAELASAATANGIKAVKSLSVITPVTGVPDSVIFEVFTRKVNESGCNTVLIVSLLDSRNDTKYIKGSSYSYDPYSHYGFYGYYPTYYASTYSTISTPGYYVSNNTYYIESNLYDVATQRILFSIQTKAVNPDDINKASHKFATTLVDELKANGLLKKKP